MTADPTYDATFGSMFRNARREVPGDRDENGPVPKNVSASYVAQLERESRLLREALSHERAFVSCRKCGEHWPCTTVRKAREQ